jgi:hypothetical protein
MGEPIQLARIIGNGVCPHKGGPLNNATIGRRPFANVFACLLAPDDKNKCEHRLPPRSDTEPARCVKDAKEVIVEAIRREPAAAGV